MLQNDQKKKKKRKRVKFKIQTMMTKERCRGATNIREKKIVRGSKAFHSYPTVPRILLLLYPTFQRAPPTLPSGTYAN